MVSDALDLAWGEGGAERGLRREGAVPPLVLIKVSPSTR